MKKWINVLSAVIFGAMLVSFASGIGEAAAHGPEKEIHHEEEMHHPEPHHEKHHHKHHEEPLVEHPEHEDKDDGDTNITVVLEL